MMDKRTVASTGGLLIIFAAVLALGGGLRAFDYLIYAADSPIVQKIASALFYWPVAVIVLLLGVILTVRANSMQRTDTQGAAASTETQDALAPNVMVLSTGIFPLDDKLQLTGTSSPARGAIIRFRNQPHQSKETGVMLGTRALLELEAPGMNKHHVAGFWLTEKSAYANFHVGDVHDLLIAVQVNGETSIPDVVPSNDDLRMWNVSRTTTITVSIELVGGISTTITRKFSFLVTVQPELRLEQR